MTPSLNDAFFKMIQFYNWCMSVRDRRSSKWPLMSSPFPTLGILLLYLTIVKYGPLYMKKRKAFELRWPLVLYNLIITSLNAWMAFELLTCGLARGYNFLCQLVDTSDNEFEVRIANAIWWYYFSKLLEFMDTIFFILRKKSSQLTFLHLYHHSTMFIFWWVGAAFVPGGCSVSGAMVNCFVHVIMYFYYTLTAFGPKIQKFLWWKKYLTILQLIQFTAGVVLGINAIVTGCPFTRWMQYVFVGYAFSFIILFGRFYKKAYIGGGGGGSTISRKKISIESDESSHVTSSSSSSKSSTGKSNRRPGRPVKGKPD